MELFLQRNMYFSAETLVELLLLASNRLGQNQVDFELYPDSRSHQQL
jgi:hypothetical protein